MTDIEGFLAIYGHSDNLLNNKAEYTASCTDAFQDDGKQRGGLYGRSKITTSFQKTSQE